jgi:hypothetical protein
MSSDGGGGPPTVLPPHDPPFDLGLLGFRGGTCAKSRIDLDQRASSGNDTALSLVERIEIDLAEPRQDYRLPKLACRRIAGPRERQGAGVFERERTCPPFGLMTS